MPKDVREVEIQHAILECMTDRRVWTNAELKRKLSKMLEWSDHDLEASPKRPNERMWENRVNNALSPSRSTSLYGCGFVENAGHGRHKITEKGVRFISEDFSLEDLI